MMKKLIIAIILSLPIATFGIERVACSSCGTELTSKEMTIKCETCKNEESNNKGKTIAIGLVLALGAVIAITISYKIEENKQTYTYDMDEKLKDKLKGIASIYRESADNIDVLIKEKTKIDMTEYRMYVNAKRTLEGYNR